MTAGRNKVTERATFWATHEPKLRAMILEHIAALVDKAADDGADDLADAGRDALVLLRAAAEMEVSPLEAMRTRLTDGTVQRHAEEAARKAEPEAKRPPRVSDEEHERRKPLPPHVLLSGRDPMPTCSHPDLRRDERGTQCRICGDRIGGER